MSHVWFREGKLYRTTADTFSVPDFPPRWLVKAGDVVGGEPVQCIAKGSLVRCIGVVSSGSNEPATYARLRLAPDVLGVFAFFEDCATREVYRYQLSLRPLWPWEEAEAEST
ncbi:MAG: hypothetical protein KIT58_10990 [Planctomycetota bacterium]|nr:hypothetical protein [Planctomycetota bacterium]